MARHDKAKRVEWPDMTDSPMAQGLAEAAAETSTFTFTVKRERIQAGKTFSEEAMSGLGALMLTWVGARVMERWVRTQEPPTVLHVTVGVDVQ